MQSRQLSRAKSGTLVRWELFARKPPTSPRINQNLLGELSTVLSDRTETAVADRIALRDAVCHYVEAERSRGTPLAVLIGTVNEILRQAEPDSYNVPDELAEQLVEWCRQFHGKRAARLLQ
jgi:hypothetical protein